VDSGDWRTMLTRARARFTKWLTPACQPICGKPIRRWHLTCLTCLDRRYANVNLRDVAFRRMTREKYLTLTHNQQFLVMLPRPGFQRQVTIPKELRMYLFLVNCTGSRLKQKLKRYLLRPLCTLIEVLANW